MYLSDAAGRSRALPTVATVDIPDGIAGIRETLKIMQRFAVEGSRDRDVYLLARALMVDAGVDPKDWAGEVRALHTFVRDDIRYTRDPADSEAVQTPAATLRIRTGDCDDKATLLAALLKSLKHPAKFVAVAFKPGELSHVYVETKIRDRWVPLETTEPWAVGRAPPGVVGRMEKNV